MTVKEITDRIISKTGMERLPDNKTCDHLMTGDYDMEVTKIVTTFMATVEVVRKAIHVGANLIITHEPTWFTGADLTGWLETDPVYLEKKALIEKNNIAIWRFHDHMHMGAEDLIYTGYDLEFGWKQYRIDNPDEHKHFGACYQIPKISLSGLCEYFKENLDMKVVQIVGNPEMVV
jgi:putative NIF3 family GTP cyclohydrolase 1 type 2